jgi:hypothetical protein
MSITGQHIAICCGLLTSAFVLLDYALFLISWAGF